MCGGISHWGRVVKRGGKEGGREGRREGRKEGGREGQRGREGGRDPFSFPSPSSEPGDKANPSPAPNPPVPNPLTPLILSFPPTDNTLLFLDPHTTQPAVQTKEDGSFSDSSYHTSNFGRMNISYLDPSIALGFFCKDEDDLDDLVARLRRVRFESIYRSSAPTT